MILLNEGKAKKIYQTEKEHEIVIEYKDDATAFDGIKKAKIESKGALNNKIASIIYAYLEKKGIKTHFIERIDDTKQRCKKVSIISIEVITRNIVSGSLSKLLQIEEGTKLKSPVFEICYKNDELCDPLINDYHAVMLNLTTFEELKTIYKITETVNRYLIEYFDQVGILLVDFKLEFGKDAEGNILLADEISPDTCRLWDKKTLEKLDKDRFRHDLGSIKEAYTEIYHRLCGHAND